MRFKFQVSDLNEAFAAVAIVSPLQMGNQGSGFLFRVEAGAEGNGVCRVYSQDGSRKASSAFDIQDLEGEGTTFAFPLEMTSVFKYLDGLVTLEAGKTEDRYWISYETNDGAAQEFTTFNPALLKPFDDEINDGDSTEYPSSLLRESLTLLKGFLADTKDSRADEAYKGIQLFDGNSEKGSGFVYAADRIRAGYFYCEALAQARGLAVHGKHIPGFLAFLSRCDKKVTIRVGKAMTYAVSGKNAFGWTHASKTHEKFSFYSFKTDKYVLRAPKESLIKALRYVRSGLDVRKDKVRVEYSCADQTLQLRASDESNKIKSQIVRTVPIDEGESGGGSEGLVSNFEFNLNINQIIDLIEPVKGNEVVLRFAVQKKDDETVSVFIRSVEEFFLNEAGRVVAPPSGGEKAFPCKVIRYMPSLR